MKTAPVLYSNISLQYVKSHKTSLSVEMSVLPSDKSVKILYNMKLPNFIINFGYIFFGGLLKST